MYVWVLDNKKKDWQWFATEKYKLHFFPEHASVGWRVKAYDLDDFRQKGKAPSITWEETLKATWTLGMAQIPDDLITFIVRDYEYCKKAELSQPIATEKPQILPPPTNEERKTLSIRSEEYHRQHAVCAAKLQRVINEWRWLRGINDTGCHH